MNTKETEKDLYWNNKGKYSKEFDQLWEELVPSEGEAESKKGELVRCLGRLHYEFYNNGNCNAVYEFPVSWSEDEDDYDYEVDDFYQDMIDYIEKHIPTASGLLRLIETIIIHQRDEDDAAYDELFDHCMPFIIKMDSKELA